MTPIQQIYWLRTSLGIVSGALCAVLAKFLEVYKHGRSKHPAILDIVNATNLHNLISNF